jgi:hypothetical protein
LSNESSAKWRLGLLWEGRISSLDSSFPNQNYVREKDSVVSRIFRFFVCAPERDSTA